MEKDKDIEFHRKLKTERLFRLNDYRKNYSVDSFISDLINYFDGGVDFNIDNIRKYVENPTKIDELIRLAKMNNSHPVIEFIQKLFKDLAAEK